MLLRLPFSRWKKIALGSGACGTGRGALVRRDELADKVASERWCGRGGREISIDEGSTLVLKSLVCRIVISSRLEVVKRERGCWSAAPEKGKAARACQEAQPFPGYLKPPDFIVPSRKFSFSIMFATACFF